MPIRDTADAVAQNLDRRFRHVLVVVGRRSFSQIFQNPEFLLTRFNILLGLHSRQFAQELKLLVGPRSAAMENWFVGLGCFWPDALEVRKKQS